MRFNLTPTIMISTRAELDSALAALRAEGVDEDWLAILQGRAERHLTEDLCGHGNLTAACHDASCAPPPAGTGGSRPSGHGGTSAPRKAAPKSASTGGVDTSQPRFFQSEFGSKIRKMIAETNELVAFHKDEVRAQFDRTMAQQREHDLHNTRNPKRMSFEYQARGMSTPEYTDPVVRARFTEAREQFDTATRIPVDRLTSPDFVPNNEAEAAVHRLYKKRLESDDPYEMIWENTEFGMVKIQRMPQPKGDPTTYPFVTPDREQAVIKVGHAIREEFEARKAKAFERIADDEVKHSAAMQEILAEAQKVNPTVDLTKIYIDRGRNGVNILLLVDGPLRDPSHPTRIRMEEIRVQHGLTSNRFNKIGIENHTHKEVLADLMSEIRPMGGELAQLPRHRASKSGGLSSNQQLTAATSMYPSDWIDASNAGRAITFKQTKGRAHYSHLSNDGNSELSLDGSHGTAVHELAHRMEYTVPGVRNLERAFHERRTAGEDSVPLGKGYRADEVTKADKFFEPYVGKIYSDAFEVMSMGWQYLQSHQGAARIDHDYQAFVFGTLAVANGGT